MGLHNYELDLDFYIKCARPLILNLKTLKDRALAAAWLKYLINDTSSSELVKLNCIKLILRVLLRGKLYGHFLQHPNSVDGLPEISPTGLDIADFCKNLQHQSQEFSLDFSADLKTYAAYQEIENFGSHCYFAFSKNPIPKWYRYNSTYFPKYVETGNMGLLNKFAEESERLSSLAVAAEEGAEAERLDEEIEQRKSIMAEQLHNKTRSDRITKNLFQPLGKIKDTAGELNDLQIDPPNWGSNLLYYKPEICPCDLFENETN